MAEFAYSIAVTDGGFVLGVDYGTSNTVAVLRWPDGRARPLLFDGTPLLPSSVFIGDDGPLVGREAMHAARSRPEAYEPNPKRRIDDGSVLLGTGEFAVAELIGMVLARVAVECRRVAGTEPSLVLTHPASWGHRRQAVLVDAAARAGLAEPALVPEPVAAGTYFVDQYGDQLPPGSAAVVYDLGAGTIDASVLRRTNTGFEVLASEGLPDAGGLDIDAALVGYLGAVYGGRAPELWQRLENPQTPADRRARRLLWEDVRGAKETLSRGSATMVPIPLLDDDAPIGREQLERLARPILDRTVAATANAVRAAGVSPGDVRRVFLVGGASRIPLAATLLHTALGVAPTAIEQPELVVAEGSIRTRPTSAPAPAARGVAAPVRAQVPAPGVPVSSPPGWPVSGLPGAPVSGMPGAPVSGAPGDHPTGSTEYAGLYGGPVPDEPGYAETSGPAWSVSPPSGVVEPAPTRPPPPQPPGNAPTPGRAPAGLSSSAKALAGSALALVLLLTVIALTYAAPRAVGLGVKLSLSYPAVLFVPAQLLLVLAHARCGGLGAGGAVVRAWGAVQYTVLFAAAHTVVYGITMPLYDSDGSLWVQVQALMAALGAVAFVVGGAVLVGAAASGRPARTGAFQRFGVPLLAGAGAATAALGVQARESNPLFWEVFHSSGLAVQDFVRYAALMVGAVLVVALAALAGAAAAGNLPAADSASGRQLRVAAGISMIVGGLLLGVASLQLLPGLGS